MTPSPNRISFTDATVEIDGEPAPGISVSGPMNLSFDDIINDDPDGLLDDEEDEEDEIDEDSDEDHPFGEPDVAETDIPFIGPMPMPEPAYVHSGDAPAWLNDARPVATDPQVMGAVLMQYLDEGDVSGWNNLMAAMREEHGQEWGPDFSHQNFHNKRFSDYDFRNANFTDVCLDDAHLRYCVMENVEFSGASLYCTQLYYTSVTDSNYKDAISWERATWSECAGYVKPLEDCTEQVARQMLIEETGRRDSFINEGLAEIREQGVRCEWRSGELHFWMVDEIERKRDACEDGECDCETEHECEGCCGHCPCYDGECGCTPDHEYGELRDTGEVYLSTVIGRITYEWDNRRGLTGKIAMNPATKHPHVSTDGSLCAGDMEVPRCLKPADYLIALLGWIGGHNPSDAYRDIEDLPRV